MNTTKTMLLCLCISMFTLVGQAQNVGQYLKDNYEKDWSFGAGFNVVDDSGSFIGGIANPSENWNFSRPFYVSAEFYLNNEFSFMTMVSFNAYKEGKQIDNAIVIEGEEVSFIAWDFNAKYSFRDILKTYKFDPYLSLGFGVTNIGDYKTLFTEYGESTIRDIPAASSITLNGAIGFNYWISTTWGINMNLAGKWHSMNQWNANYKQYSLGAVYFLN